MARIASVCSLTVDRTGGEGWPVRPLRRVFHFQPQSQRGLLRTLGVRWLCLRRPTVPMETATYFRNRAWGDIIANMSVRTMTRACFASIATRQPPFNHRGYADAREEFNLREETVAHLCRELLVDKEPRRTECLPGSESPPSPSRGISIDVLGPLALGSVDVPFRLPSEAGVCSSNEMQPQIETREVPRYD